MSKLDDLATVVRLASLTEDRAPDEQRALLATALDVDQRRGRFTVPNHEPIRPCLVPLVEPYEPSEGKPVGLSLAQVEAYNRLLLKWEACAQCGNPVGAHGPNGCLTPALS